MIATDLFEWGEAHARVADLDTAQVAADEVEGPRAGWLEQKVYWAIKESDDGLTNHEIVEKTDLPWNTCTPRLRPLVRKGLIIDSGQRRMGPCHRKCIVWKIRPASGTEQFPEPMPDRTGLP